MHNSVIASSFWIANLLLKLFCCNANIIPVACQWNFMHCLSSTMNAYTYNSLGDTITQQGQGSSRHLFAASSREQRTAALLIRAVVACEDWCCTITYSVLAQCGTDWLHSPTIYLAYLARCFLAPPGNSGAVSLRAVLFTFVGNGGNGSTQVIRYNHYCWQCWKADKGVP